MRAEAAKYRLERYRRVLRHIEANLDRGLSGDPGGDLDLDTLSSVAALSKFHFHREFTALFGIGVHRYVRLARLKRACWRLAFRQEASVLEVALDGGYRGPESFARAFRRHLGQSPGEFRNQPHWRNWDAAFRPAADIRRRHMTEDLPAVEIVERPEVRVAVLAHRGDPALIGDTIRRFIAWRRQVGLHPRTSDTYSILYDDPLETPPERFRLDLCAATDAPVAANGAGVAAGSIPGGRCAMLRHRGPEEGMRAAILHLYRDWLPGSGETLREAPFYCRRVSFFPDVPESEAVTELYLPLA